MWKRVRLVIWGMALAVLLGSILYVFIVKKRYRDEAEVYELAAGTYVHHVEQDEDADVPPEEQEDRPPITVDFDSLLEECPDIVGWIYCDNTPVSYPIVQGPDNDYYLRRSYKGVPMTAGTIFVDV